MLGKVKPNYFRKESNTGPISLRVRWAWVPASPGVLSAIVKFDLRKERPPTITT